MNTILIILELLIILNTNYSKVNSITMIFLAAYFLLIGLMTKSIGYFSLRISLLLLFIIGVLNIGVFFF